MSISQLPRRLFVPGETPADTSFEDWLEGIRSAHEKLGFKGPGVLICVDEDGDVVFSSTTGDLAKVNIYLDIVKKHVLSMAAGEYDGD